MFWNFFQYSFQLEGHNKKVNTCNNMLSRDRLNKEPHLPSLKSGSSQPEQKRKFCQDHHSSRKNEDPDTSYHKVKHIWCSSTTQMHLTCVHRSCRAAEYSRVTEVLTLGSPTCSTRLYSSCNCFLQPTSLKSPSCREWGRGPGPEESYAGSHQADARCFYQGLSRACSTDMGVYKSHTNKMQLLQHITSAGMSPRAVQTHQATRPITQAQTGALLIRQWRARHNIQPQNTLRQHMSTASHGVRITDINYMTGLHTLQQFAGFFSGLAFIYKGKKSLAGSFIFRSRKCWVN